MARSKHTPEERQRMITETRQLLKEGAKFQMVASSFGVKPEALRRWMNAQTRDWLYPKMENMGRIQ